MKLTQTKFPNNSKQKIEELSSKKENLASALCMHPWKEDKTMTKKQRDSVQSPSPTSPTLFKKPNFSYSRKPSPKVQIIQSLGEDVLG